MRRSACLAALSLLLAGTTASAAPCRDKVGKFIKCAPAKAAPCRDAHGKFVACGSAATAAPSAAHR